MPACPESGRLTLLYWDIKSFSSYVFTDLQLSQPNMSLQVRLKVNIIIKSYSLMHEFIQESFHN